MAQYTLRVPSLYIHQTRSPQSDTLMASMALRVMNAEGALHKDWPPQAVALGDWASNAPIFMGLSYPDVDVPDPTVESADGGAI